MVGISWRPTSTNCLLSMIQLPTLRVLLILKCLYVFDVCQFWKVCTCLLKIQSNIILVLTSSDFYWIWPFLVCSVHTFYCRLLNVVVMIFLYLKILVEPACPYNFPATSIHAHWRWSWWTSGIIQYNFTNSCAKIIIQFGS